MSTYLETVRITYIMEFEKSFEKNWSNQKNIGLTAYLQKMKGEAREKDRIDYVDSFVSAIGGLIAIIIISFIAVYIGHPMALAPLGASCVIVFCAIKVSCLNLVMLLEDIYSPLLQHLSFGDYYKNCSSSSSSKCHCFYQFSSWVGTPDFDCNRNLFISFYINDL